MKRLKSQPLAGQRREAEASGIGGDVLKLLEKLFEMYTTGDEGMLPNVEYSTLLRIRKLNDFHASKGAHLAGKTQLSRQSLLTCSLLDFTPTVYSQDTFLASLRPTYDLWHVESFSWEQYSFSDCLTWSDFKEGWYSQINKSMVRLGNAKLSLHSEVSHCLEIERSLAALAITYPKVASVLRSKIPHNAHPFALRSFYSMVTDSALKTATNPFNKAHPYHWACGYETTTGLIETDDLSTGFDFAAQFNDIAGTGAWERDVAVQAQLNDLIKEIVAENSAMRKQFDTEVEFQTRPPTLLEFTRRPWLWGTPSSAGKPLFRPAWPKGRKTKYEFAAYLQQFTDAELQEFFERNRQCIAWPFVKSEPGKNRVASNVDVATYLRDAWLAYICPLRVNTFSPMNNDGVDQAQFGLLRSALLSDNVYNIPADASKWDQQQSMQSVMAYFNARADCVDTSLLSEWDKEQINVYRYSHAHPLLIPTRAQQSAFGVARIEVRGSVLSGLYDTAWLNTTINQASIRLASRLSGVPVVYSQSMGDDMDIAVRRLDGALRFVTELRRIQNINLSKSLISIHHSQMLRRDFHANREVGQVGRAWSSILYRKPVSEPDSTIETRIQTTASSYSTLLRRLGPHDAVEKIKRLALQEMESQLRSHSIPFCVLRSVLGPLAHPFFAGPSNTVNSSRVLEDVGRPSFTFEPLPGLNAEQTFFLTSPWTTLSKKKFKYSASPFKPMVKTVDRILSAGRKHAQLPSWLGGASQLTTISRTALQVECATSAKMVKTALSPYVPQNVLNRFPMRRIKDLFFGGLDSLAAFEPWSAGQLAFVSDQLKNNIWSLSRYALLRKDTLKEKNLLAAYSLEVSRKYHEIINAPFNFYV